MVPALCLGMKFALSDLFADILIQPATLQWMLSSVGLASSELTQKRVMSSINHPAVFLQSCISIVNNDIVNFDGIILRVKMNWICLLQI